MRATEERRRLQEQEAVQECIKQSLLDDAHKLKAEQEAIKRDEANRQIRADWEEKERQWREDEAEEAERIAREEAEEVAEEQAMRSRAQSQKVMEEVA